MIFNEPTLTSADRAVLALIGDQRDRLRVFTQSNPRRWIGSLRRSTFARAIQGSNSIEGYNTTIDEAIAAVDNEPPPDDRTETWLAITGYRHALTYILQASQDENFEFGKQFLKGLHFMMMNYWMDKNPGRWRPGTVFVLRQQDGQAVYEGPDAGIVDDLVEELVGYVGTSGENFIVKAAMAHLNLTMIHPFSDGNGRMARALQTLILARGGILHPLFSSIEEWLGRNTNTYYSALAKVGQGKWNPQNDAGPWIQFCLTAHYQQAATLIRRNEEYGALYERIEELATMHGLPDRVLIPLFDAAQGRRLTNARYQAEAETTQHIASRDLRRLSELAILEPLGEKRGRVYLAGRMLKEIRRAVRIGRPLADPYELVDKERPMQADEPRIPGL